MTNSASYPYGPGHHYVDTSIAAAASIAPTLGRLQQMVRDAIANAGIYGATTNEIAAHLNIDRGSVQPRTSELKRSGAIRDSGVRRLNANGKKAIVWVAAAQEAEVRHD